MVYMDAAILGWKSYTMMWIRKLPAHVDLQLKDHITNLFDTYIQAGLTYIRKCATEYVKSVDLNLVISLCRLLQTYINQTTVIDFSMSIADLKVFFSHLFVFSYVWSIGGNVADGCQDGFDTFFKEIIDNNLLEGVTLPPNSIFSYFVDLKNRCFVPWYVIANSREDIVPLFKYSNEIPYFEMMVPTVLRSNLG
jgi:dynein heavy chain, axonemal